MPLCRICKNELQRVLSLGEMPLSNSYLRQEQLGQAEKYYPLDLYFCPQCFLVQLEEVVPAQDIFSDYAYFSSYSESWLNHCREYVQNIIPRLGLDNGSQVIEIASNDGGLLQFFKEKNIPILGIEPAANVARAARNSGIPTREMFFGIDAARLLAEEGLYADLLIGNNVLAHVPALNSFVAGLKIILKPRGVITLEFPHLQRLIEGAQYDTIYHEHFSYFSFFTAEKLLAAHRLTVFDVEELPTHGGSLRIYARHREDNSRSITSRVKALREKEKSACLNNIEQFASFAKRIEILKNRVLSFLNHAQEKGKIVAAYGAPAKANTLLNYCGISPALISFTVDRNPFKQGLFLPGSHIPIKAPEFIKIVRPDYIIILPWNLREEITRQLEFIREWNGRFVTFIPEIKVF
ncbi:MAG: class I SAM-dependent methyltransferase [Syntrophomonas sp.]